MIKQEIKEQVDISKLPIINIGMVGHIDHGKTTLLASLTGKFADTHSEELKRGITIKLGYADTVLYKDSNGYNNKSGNPQKYLTFVDVPGHEMLMATMLSGAAIIDAAILLVAANEGIKPQTKEHLIALQAKKVEQVIIVQNKIDLVTKEEARDNYKKIKDFVKGTIAENSPIIPVSAQHKINIEKIFEAINEIKIIERKENADPVFIIARSFDINRPGTPAKELHGGVIGGTLKQGILRVGDKIEIKPGLLITEKNQKNYETVKTKVISMQRGNFELITATPGGSLAIETELDMNITRADNLSGCIVGLDNKLPEIKNKIKIKASLFEKVIGSDNDQQVEAFKPSELLMLSINTSTSVGKVHFIKGNIIDLDLNIPLVIFKEDNVGIARNFNGHWRLVGFGEIIE
ncbi:MAG TPA: translation initiation factor IF-2 subunit gamma [Candidatus Paceibacterota bacterium]|nr:translation initiation factor IF-2 subunit gamma [Candidatus Paceibacterota bacterium]